ncbi:MAG: protease-like activity factor CPAF [Bdellovibrionales bacterium]
MKFALRALCGAVVLSFSGAAFADSVKDTIALEMSFIKRVFETGYAPTEWKKEHLNWDLQAEYQQAMEDLNSMTEVTARDYRRLIAGLLTSTKDYHVGFTFFTTEAASLPFLINGTNGKYYVVRVDKSKLDQKSFPIKVGDRIVTFGGRPIADVIEEIRTQIAWGEASTDQRLAERLLTRRLAAMALDVPQGRVEVEFARMASDAGKSDNSTGAQKETSFTLQFTWEYTPESVPWNPQAHSTRLSLARSESKQTGFLNPQMRWGMSDILAAPKHDKGEDEDNFVIGGRKSFVPQLGPVVWEAQKKDKFHAYVYKADGGRLIGYIRIPHYSENTATFEAFKALIKKMEPITDALVIDQVNNPGGSIFYVLSLMSVLSKDPIKVPDHHITLWPAMISEVHELREKLRDVKNDKDARKAMGEEKMDGYPVNFQFAQSLLGFTDEVMAQWKEKRTFTTPLHLWGVDKVNPDAEVNYTKPILVLVNELDFSGGDFFPAILQDNVRAKIFGQRTSGAGGYVLQVEFPSALGLKSFSFTGSLARRVNNQPIENLGVTPDIPYTYTERDLREGFVDYKDAVNKAVLGLL